MISYFIGASQIQEVLGCSSIDILARRTKCLSLTKEQPSCQFVQEISFQTLEMEKKQSRPSFVKRVKFMQQLINYSSRDNNSIIQKKKWGEF